MSVQTNFRAVDMLGGPAKVETVVEAVKPVAKKATKTPAVKATAKVTKAELEDAPF